MQKIIVLRSNPKDAAFERVALTLAGAYRVECWIWDRQGDYAPSAEHPRVTHRMFRLRTAYHSAGTLCKLFLFEAWLFVRLLFAHYDCIHAIDLDMGIIGLFASKMRRKPLAYHCLDPYAAAIPRSWPKVLGLIAHKLENFVISGADLFIITDLLRMPQHKDARPKKIVEFANVPHVLHTLAPKVNESFLITGYIGSLIEGRNLRTIIEAVGELEDKNIRLVMGGFGPLEQELRDLCKCYRNVALVRWVPYERVLELEGTFDVMLHITDSESLSQKWVSPNKLFESMALGKPIIVGKETLTGERTARMGNGIAITYGSKEELQEALLYLKDHPEERHDMGERGLKEFQKNWTHDIMADRLRHAYDNLLRTCN